LCRGINCPERRRHAAARHENSCLAIYFYKGNTHAFPEICGDSLNKRFHTFATGDWDSRRAHKSTTVCVRDNILCEEPFQSGVRDTGGKVTLAIHDCPKPVIAAINGAAVGIGATMTLAMDIRLASTKARIGFVFGKLGIVPEAASSWFLPRIVGLQQALEWIYSAEILTAEQALAGRLVRSVHEPDELLETAHALARSFVVGRSPVALALAKQLVYRNSAVAHPLEAHRADSLAMWHASVGDGKEGVAAFLEKREPRFTGRASDLPEIF